MEVLRYVNHDLVPSSKDDTFVTDVPMESEIYIAIVKKDDLLTCKKVPKSSWIKMPKDIVKPEFAFTVDSNGNYTTVKQNWLFLNHRNINPVTVGPDKVVLIGYKKVSKWLKFLNSFKITFEVKRVNE